MTRKRAEGVVVLNMEALGMKAEYSQLAEQQTQRLSDLINSAAQAMTQRYYILDQYATELLKALDFGDATRIEKAKSDLARFLKNQY